MKFLFSIYSFLIGIVFITKPLNAKLPSYNRSRKLSVLTLSTTQLASIKRSTTKEKPNFEDKNVSFGSSKKKVKTTKKNSSYIEPISQTQFKLIPAGIFQMGGENDSEKPIHKVHISHDFYMSKYEITHKEYIQFMNAKKVTPYGVFAGVKWVDMNDKDCAVGFANGSFYFKGSGYAKTENTPMIEVTWYGAKAYADWLSEQTGKKFRLPTEAEWEYAARAGKKHVFAGSNNVTKVAWCGDMTINEIQAVGLKKPNAFGLYDMTGNVWEWCSDWYHKNYYKTSPSIDPSGPRTGSRRVIRGGSWDLLPFFCLNGIRNSDKPSLSQDNHGFRLVVSD